MDHDKPREHSIAIDLKDVDRLEFQVRLLHRVGLGRLAELICSRQAGFLKSSPKIIVFPKPSRYPVGPLRTPVASGASSGSGSSTPLPGGAAAAGSAVSGISGAPRLSGTWICPICSFSNPVPSNFDAATVNAHTPIPPCLTCGVVPPLKDVLKAAIAHASRAEGSSSRPSADRIYQDVANSEPVEEAHSRWDGHATDGSDTARSTFACPRCTFLNHPSLKVCEICGAALPTSDGDGVGIMGLVDGQRADSPGPFVTKPGYTPSEAPESVKLSFRAGGDKVFYERLKGAMVQRKWLLQGAPPVPKPDSEAWKRSSLPGTPVGPGSGRNSPYERQDRVRTVGLAGLEQRDFNTRKNNEIVIGTAFEDLEALMASAKEVAALAEKFSGAIAASSNPGSSEASALLSQSATALGLMTTKDVLGSGSASESLYVSELSRNLAEFLTDDATGILRREGGIITLVDLWAVFNRARGGVELVSPLDFHKAASLWEKLNLPVRLRQFRSGVLVVQGKDRTDERTISSLLAWLRTLREAVADQVVPWDVGRFGKGVTPQETAEKFGWSVGVASEELQMAEEQGALCREESVEGVRFWENWLTGQDAASTAPPEQR